MNKEKTFYDNVKGDYPQQQIPEIRSSKPSDSDIDTFKRLYLPTSKINYQPSMESIERANGLNYSKSEPSDSDIDTFKRLYLPSSKADYYPSVESIERANDLNCSNPNTLI